MSVKEAFDKHAHLYDGLRRQLIPAMDEYQGAAVACLEHLGMEAPRILDLGAGTGLLSAMALEAYPKAELTLVDLAPLMLEQAKARFAGRENVRFLEADYVRGDVGGPYDAIISCLSIHHLENPDKQALFQRAMELIRPGGLFINADQILGPDPDAAKWFAGVWERRVRAAGVTDEQLAQAHERMKYDRLETLAKQTAWMAEAGFQDIITVYQWFALTVIMARRPL